MDSLVSSPKSICDERAGPKPNAASKRINVRPTLARPESPATGTARAAATPNPAVFPNTRHIRSRIATDMALFYVERKEMSLIAGALIERGLIARVPYSYFSLKREKYGPRSQSTFRLEAD